MQSDRRGFFKKLMGLAAMVIAAPVVEETLKLPAASERASSFIGFNATGNTCTIPGTVTWIGGAGGSGYITTVESANSSWVYTYTYAYPTSNQIVSKVVTNGGLNG